MVFVTGGTGLVGSHLLVELLKNGEKVRALKRKSSSLELSLKIFNYYNLKIEDYSGNLEWVDGDLLDYPRLEEIFDDIDYVYHCAAIVSFDSSDKDKLLTNNIRSTENIVNISLDKEVKKFAYISSIASLGRANNKNDITDENTDMDLSGDNSIYSLSKYHAEKEVWRGIAEGLDAVIVNPSIILGYGDWSKGSCQMFKTGYNNLKFYTEGVNGFIDVTDVAKILIHLMKLKMNVLFYLLKILPIKIFMILWQIVLEKRDHL